MTETNKPRFSSETWERLAALLEGSEVEARPESGAQESICVQCKGRTYAAFVGRCSAELQIRVGAVGGNQPLGHDALCRFAKGEQLDEAASIRFGIGKKEDSGKTDVLFQRYYNQAGWLWTPPAEITSIIATAISADLAQNTP
jgi:hypothetical protein